MVNWKSPLPKKKAKAGKERKAGSSSDGRSNRGSRSSEDQHSRPATSRTSGSTASESLQQSVITLKMSSSQVSPRAREVGYSQRAFMSRLWSIVSSPAGSLPSRLGQETARLRSVFQSLSENEDPSIAQSALTLWQQFEGSDETQTPEAQMPRAGRRDRGVQVDDDGWEIPPAWLVTPGKRTMARAPRQATSPDGILVLVL